MIVTLAAWAALGACGGESGSGEDSVSSATAAGAVTAKRADSAAPVAPRTALPGPNASGCVSEGDWQACSVEKRLTDAGFVPIRKGASPAGVFDVAGTTYALGPAELSVYLFPSAKAREAAVSGIDTVAVARRGSASPWSMAPTLITSNNLVGILVSDNGRLIERVQNAITAGLPSAPR